MPRLTLSLVLTVTALALSACAANPIVARDPVPAPTGGESFACDSRPTLVNAFMTDCEPHRRRTRGAITVKG